VDAHGCVVRVFITAGTTNDCKLGIQLFQGLDIIGLMADRGYDAEIYRHRHIVENVFLILKQWRGIATRYAKLTSSYLATIHLRCSYCYFN